tara:strand:+ start:36 stop:485 length:450 start_codon:yes stop_codon:yes gene_type:complete
MNNLPFDIIIKIYSYLPILSIEQINLNEQIKKNYFKRKWFNIYKNIQEYSIDKDDDDYYINWLENDIISALNHDKPLMEGLSLHLRYVLRRIHGYSISTLQEYDYLNIGDPSKSIDIFFKILDINEVKILDRRLEKYNNKLFNTNYFIR